MNGPSRDGGKGARSALDFTARDEELLKGLSVGRAKGMHELAERSISVYRDKLLQLKRLRGTGLEELIKDVKGTYGALLKEYTSVTSRKAYVTAISSLLTRNPVLARRMSTAQASWRNLLSVLQAAEKEVRNNTRVTTEQRKTMVTQKEKEAARKKLGKRCLESLRVSQHYLLLWLLTDIPPKRLDYNALWIMKKEPVAETKGNYIVVPSQGTVRLVLQEYKTSKTYDTLEEEMPSDLSDAIRASLRAYPRDYLFVGRDGKATTQHTFGMWVKTVFLEHLGKATTMNAIRHSYITEHARGDHTYGEQAELARRMGHNTDQQMQYVRAGWG